MDEWKAADRNLGTQFTGELKRFRERLKSVDAAGTYDTPGAVLNAAFGALSERLDGLDSRGPRSAPAHTQMTDVAKRFGSGAGKTQSGSDG